MKKIVSTMLIEMMTVGCGKTVELVSLPKSTYSGERTYS